MKWGDFNNISQGFSEDLLRWRQCLVHSRYSVKASSLFCPLFPKQARETASYMGRHIGPTVT